MPAAGLGDFVMAVPAIKAIRAKYPNAYIAVFAHHKRGIDQLQEFVPQINEIIDFPLKKYSWPTVIK